MSRRVDSVRFVPLSKIAVGGLLLALLAEVGSVGLLGVSGWFIASCAIAGATLFSTFSYLTPSAAVRSFALLRIGANYCQRLVLHSAVLNQLTKIRLAFFVATTTAPVQVVRRLRAGDLLDRSMNDATVESMTLIQTVAPVLTYLVVGLSAIGVAWLSSPVASLGMLIGWAFGIGLTAFDEHRQRRLQTEDSKRRALRAELVAAINAWPEMISIGALDRVEARAKQRLDVFSQAQNKAQRHVGAARWRFGCLVAFTIGGVVYLATAVDKGNAAMVSLVALLVFGVCNMGSQLASALNAWYLAKAARYRRQHIADIGGLVKTVQATVRLTKKQLIIENYQLPATVFQPARLLSERFTLGKTLLVTGRSGSGKSTLLAALAESLQHQKTSAVFVPADDYTFTGTVASNFELADETATESTMTKLLDAMWLSKNEITPNTLVGVQGRELSGGEQTRFHIARALLARPDILLIDEPTAGLDSATAWQVFTTIRTYLPKATIILAIHEPPKLPDSYGVPQQLPIDRYVGYTIKKEVKKYENSSLPGPSL